VDIGGYYLTDTAKCQSIMRPSATLNAVLAQVANPAGVRPAA
jgi:isocitrate dehydrogenase